MLNSENIRPINLYSKEVISPRTGASIVSLNSSQLLVFGGASPEEGFSNAMFLLDLQESSCRQLHSASSNIPPSRYDHFSHEYERGIIMFGGADQETCYSDTWIFNFKSLEWTFLDTRGEAPMPRTARGAATLLNDRLYVCGGGLTGSTPVPNMDVHCLDLHTLQWSKWEAIGPSPRLGHSLHATSSTLLLYGGMSEMQLLKDAWSFDLTSHTWHTLGTFPELAGHASILLKDELWITGGLTKNLEISKDILKYDKGVWEKRGELPHRTDHSIARLENTNTFLIFGGMDHVGIYNDIILIDTDAL